MAEERTRRSSRVLLVARYGVPVAIFVAGLLVTLTAANEAMTGLGTALMGVAVLVVMLNFFMRLSIRSGDDREREERAREHFDRHGTWPGPSKR